MKQTITYRLFRPFAAMLLVTLLLFSYAAKPIHILFVHSNQAENIIPVTDKQMVSIPDNSDCPVCNFEFCSFVNQNSTVENGISFSYSSLYSFPLQTSTVNLSVRHFQLRAPPVIC